MNQMKNKNSRRKIQRTAPAGGSVDGKTGFSSRPLAGEDPRQLIHELQIFQVELELQNDELRCTQQELMEFKIHYTQLYDFTPVGYVTLDANGKILNANLTLARMLETERSALIERPLSDHVLPRDQDIYYLHLQALFESKKRQICDLKMKKRTGSTLTRNWKARLFRNPSRRKPGTAP